MYTDLSWNNQWDNSINDIGISCFVPIGHLADGPHTLRIHLNSYFIPLVEKIDNNRTIEEYIEGREITVGVLGNRVLPIVEVFPKKDLFDYECKYLDGMSKYEVPANIDKDKMLKIQKDALKIHEAIGCRHYSRVDFLLDKENDHYFLAITLYFLNSFSQKPSQHLHMLIEFW